MMASDKVFERLLSVFTLPEAYAICGALGVAEAHLDELGTHVGTRGLEAFRVLVASMRDDTEVPE